MLLRWSRLLHTVFFSAKGVLTEAKNVDSVQNRETIHRKNKRWWSCWDKKQKVQTRSPVYPLATIIGIIYFEMKNRTDNRKRNALNQNNAMQCHHLIYLFYWAWENNLDFGKISGKYGGLTLCAPCDQKWFKERCWVAPGPHPGGCSRGVVRA